MTAPCLRCDGRGQVYPRWGGRSTGAPSSRLIECPGCRGTGRSSATNRGTSAAAAREAAIVALVPIWGTPSFHTLNHETRQAVVAWMRDHQASPVVVDALQRVVRDIGLDIAVPELAALLFPESPDAAPLDN